MKGAWGGCSAIASPLSRRPRSVTTHMDVLTSDLLTATSILALLASAGIARRNGVSRLQTATIAVVGMVFTILYLLGRVEVITLGSPSGPAIALVAYTLVSGAVLFYRAGTRVGRV